MPRETPLLLALIAFRRGYISEEQLLEATAAWMKDPANDLVAVLVKTGQLAPKAAAEIARTAAEWEGIRRRIPSTVRETLLAPRGDDPVPVGEAVATGDRYQAGRELGRGGIGRVIEALDHVLGRSVALKILHGSTPHDFSERFRWEARITGRLEHPNIVPVHDVGVLPATGEQFMAMKRIVGRDLGQIVQEGSVPLRRLVEALRDASRAISYAHSRGVIHRDLKPANIMLGDFGEVLVVDWGLSRLVGEEDRAVQLRKPATRAPGRVDSPIASREETSHITIDGDVLGTPAYMPPEQARGMLQKIDERSDVYSLGATLYEVLAGKPPFLRESSREVLEAVVEGKLEPPSQLRACPPELETICLRAMAHKPEDRFASVADLSRELDAWLEGALERDRRERMAGEELRRAEEGATRWRKANADIERHEQTLRDEDLSSAALATERIMGMFDIEDAITAASRESALALAEANAALDTALSLVPGHAASRRLKAEIYWEQFVQAEKTGGHAAMEVARRMAEVFNDGSLDARLRGDGTLEVRTRIWACPCLVSGRPVAPPELYEDHWLLWSGARRDGKPTDHAPELTPPVAPMSLRVHGRSCRHESLDGAEVWAFRYEERERVLVPVTPEGTAAGPPIPASLLDLAFGRSPYRPVGPGLYLGRTPIPPRPWPLGSWLLVLSAPGRLPQRLPFELSRLQDLSLDATLYRPEEVPPGHAVILGGPFDSIREAGSNPIIDPVNLQDFFMATFPVTSSTWADWLNGMGPARGGEARARRPRINPNSGHLWPWVNDRVEIPTAELLASLQAAGKVGELEGLRGEVGTTKWLPDWPVLGISWIDAMAWNRERSLTEGRAFTLPTMFQWERAGRGGDRRRYPWGMRVWSELSNTNRSLPAGQSPSPVDSFPRDESPWGIRGLGGNVGTHCLNDAGASYRNWRALRGGSWTRPEVMARLSYHQGTPPQNIRKDIGIRSVALTVAGWA